MVEKVDGLLCILEDAFVKVDRNNTFSHYVSNDGNKNLFIYSDIYNETTFEIFKYAIANANGEKVVYMYSSDNNVDETLFMDMVGVNVKPIPSKIYEIYKEIVEDIKRGE